MFGRVASGDGKGRLDKFPIEQSEQDGKCFLITDGVSSFGQDVNDDDFAIRIIVGRSGSGIDKIKDDLEKKLKCSTQIRVNVTEVKNMYADANLIGEFIAEQLEKRIPFKRATRQAIQKAQRANAKGIRVQVSGRLNGAEIARSEWVREGRVPLQTLRADIDYATKEANTTYGILGIKVWVFNGEIIPDKSKRRLSV